MSAGVESVYDGQRSTDECDDVDHFTSCQPLSTHDGREADGAARRAGPFATAATCTLCYDAEKFVQ